mmetsp:Transcript_24220/g.67809  ORF Transcript_24220/g.67809 Transcript_24220/m.67809 type:complete len:205 (-) Transcript_24220:150-764(-)
MNLRMTGRTSFESVALNIITCLSCGVALKISWMSARMSSCSSILSHSSRMKWRTLLRLRSPSFTSCFTRPGVPTTMLGQLALRSSFCFFTLTPPKNTPILMSFKYTLNLSNSWQIWKASSRVWQRTTAPTVSAWASSCCSTASTNTAVLPTPALAWQITSIPSTACGMHSCCTSEGCSKPQSTMARRSSGLSRKSLNPVEWIPT